MKLFSVPLPLYLAIICGVSVQSDNNPKQDAAGDAVLLATLQNVERILGVPCPRGWTRFKTYCYLVNESSMTRDQAQAHCKGLGGGLVKINSAEENEFVLSLVNRRAPSLKQVWIGLKWNPNVNDFLWHDNSVPVYKNWAPKEPNGKAMEPCGNMWTGRTTTLPYHASGYWNDHHCSSWSSGVVCKRLP